MSQEFSKRKAGRQDKTTKSVRAELVMPVFRFHTSLRKKKYAKRISDGASVYLTAAIQYLCTEMLEAAGELAIKAKRHRITPRYINLAVRDDAELNELLKNVVLPEGGVVPRIRKVLEKKKTKTRNTNTKSDH